jgi:hypothetical protein
VSPYFVMFSNDKETILCQQTGNIRFVESIFCLIRDS